MNAAANYLFGGYVSDQAEAGAKPQAVRGAAIAEQYRTHFAEPQCEVWRQQHEASQGANRVRPDAQVRYELWLATGEL